MLYRLRFSTALHIGKGSGGASLDDGQMNIHADTLFSALCCECAPGNNLTELVNYFNEGIMTISDALPFAGEEIFLPKPVLFIGHKKREGDAGLKKRLKAIEYIPLSLFNEYLQGLQKAMPNLENLQYTFGQLTTISRVAIKGNSPPLPYHVAAWNFAPGCGLYLILRYEGINARERFTNLLARLGISGIGGKQSSGWGKFEINTSPVPAELLKLLEDDQARYQMLLGTALPEDEELERILENGWHTLVRRGGFIRSAAYAPGQMKKRSLYMLGPGSCLAERFPGGMYDLSDHGAHPVWRCGKSLFVGVNV